MEFEQSSQLIKPVFGKQRSHPKKETEKKGEEKGQDSGMRCMLDQEKGLIDKKQGSDQDMPRSSIRLGNKESQQTFLFILFRTAPAGFRWSIHNFFGVRF